MVISLARATFSGEASPLKMICCDLLFAVGDIIVQQRNIAICHKGILTVWDYSHITLVTEIQTKHIQPRFK